MQTGHRVVVASFHLLTSKLSDGCNGEIVAPHGTGPTVLFPSWLALCQRWWVPLNHLLTQGSQPDHRLVSWCAQSRTGIAIVLGHEMLGQLAVALGLQVNTLTISECVPFFPSMRSLTAVPL